MSTLPSCWEPAFTLRRKRRGIFSHPAQQVGFPFWTFTLGECSKVEGVPGPQASHCGLASLHRLEHGCRRPLVPAASSFDWSVRAQSLGKSLDPASLTWLHLCQDGGDGDGDAHFSDGFALSHTGLELRPPGRLGRALMGSECGSPCLSHMNLAPEDTLSLALTTPFPIPV